MPRDCKQRIEVLIDKPRVDQKQIKRFAGPSYISFVVVAFTSGKTAP
jgi:hypothetical protein